MSDDVFVQRFFCKSALFCQRSNRFCLRRRIVSSCARTNENNVMKRKKYNGFALIKFPWNYFLWEKVGKYLGRKKNVFWKTFEDVLIFHPIFPNNISSEELQIEYPFRIFVLLLKKRTNFCNTHQGFFKNHLQFLPLRGKESPETFVGWTMEQKNRS